MSESPLCIRVPALALVVLVGASGSGKSCFARKHFLPTEVVSSDACRAMIADDENELSVTAEAFELVHAIASRRLAAGRLTVIDATSVQPEARKPLVALARKHDCLPVAIVLDMPESVCRERNEKRADRSFGPHVLRNQRRELRQSLRGLAREGFRHVFVMTSPEEVDTAEVTRVPLWNDRRAEHGPFDIIGDVHGCCTELEGLLEKLGYAPVELAEDDAAWGRRSFRHPAGRRAIFLGDLVDRGPRVLDTVRLVRNMVKDGAALAIPGNHDAKLVRKLAGRDVQITHGLDRSLAEMETQPEATVAQVRAFLEGLVGHYVLDGGCLVVAHAGLKQEMHGRASARVREFSLYGETTGESDEFGLPVRLNWAADYRGKATVVYGHTPVPEPDWLNNTVNIDTGCVFGGSLTALRHPEREFVSVPALAVYATPIRPLAPAEAGLSAQQASDDLLDAEDVLGKRYIRTRLGSVKVREENAAAALEIMSRFAVNPKWLIYLPPTMSPCETSQAEGYLEHPAEAFAFFRCAGVAHVVCQQKHMGSRAVVIVCRDAEVARQRFGVADGSAGVVYTRTGRPFFSEEGLEAAFLGRLRAALDASAFWERHETGWVCLDCELMPWSAKAQDLLRTQYAAVGAAARPSLDEAVAALRQGSARPDLDDPAAVQALLEHYTRREARAASFVAAYRQYCWSVRSLDDLRLAPFHVMATEGGVHADRDHAWHMRAIGEVGRHDGALLVATEHLMVDVTDEASQEKATAWWLDYTTRGGEGMVVKPLDFTTRGRRGLVQPAVKCRGREYLRLIYGPDYDSPENLVRLRNRGLAAKRGLALHEFSLGVEALERFVRREPLRRVHECAFAVLALESEPVDPRL